MCVKADFSPSVPDCHIVAVLSEVLYLSPCLAIQWEGSLPKLHHKQLFLSFSFFFFSKGNQTAKDHRELACCAYKEMLNSVVGSLIKWIPFAVIVELKSAYVFFFFFFSLLGDDCSWLKTALWTRKQPSQHRMVTCKGPCGGSLRVLLFVWVGNKGEEPKGWKRRSGNY